MTWFRVDDSFPQHPKVLRIPRKDRCAAIGLWTLAGGWCASQLTDGHLGAHMIEEFASEDRYAELLVLVGLWERTEDGFVFHDWADWQPTRAEVQEKRDAEARRKASWRDRKRAGAGQETAGPADVPPGHPQDNDVSPADVPPDETRDTDAGPGGVPAEETRESALSRPDPSLLTTCPVSDPDERDDGFAEFWAAYPRRLAKRKAEQAWRAALKRADRETIMLGLKRFPFRPDPQFIPHPASWLNADRWADESTTTPVDGGLKPWEL